MSELIAIPIESDRRAVEVLAAMRWLQAEYQGDPEASGASPNDTAPPIVSRPGRLRRAWRPFRFGALAALVGSVTGATMALLTAALVLGLPSMSSLPGGAPAALAAAGALMGATVGATLHVLLHRRRLPVKPDAPTVTWLVSYIMRDGPSPDARRMRASIIQVTLPAEAEGRLKAILARAATTAAR
jgi:uncharacterized membrane protein